jgi:hypothetical protein
MHQASHSKNEGSAAGLGGLRRVRAPRGNGLLGARRPVSSQAPSPVRTRRPLLRRGAGLLQWAKWRPRSICGHGREGDVHGRENRGHEVNAICELNL